MAVRKRTYHGYSGPLSGERTRFLVLFRYAWKSVMSSRFATVYLVICLLVPVIFGAIIYVCHSTFLLQFFGGGPEAASKLVDAKFFYVFIRIELGLALILTAFTGPGLIAPDLANQALPLYLCRPVSRAEYVLGKFSVLALLLSVITWVPGLILFALQGDLAGWAWISSHFWIAGGIFFGSLVTVVVYSALALALSAWFKRKVVAAGAFLAVFYIGAGVGQGFDAALRTEWGGLIDIGGLMNRVVSGLFRLPAVLTDRVNHHARIGFSPAVAGIALFVACAFCAFLIERRIRAREVVRQ